MSASSSTLHNMTPDQCTALVRDRLSLHRGPRGPLADTAFGAACNTTGDGALVVASSCDVTFVAPGREGDVLLAEASERLSFGRSGLFDVTVARADGAVLLEFRGHSRQLTTPP